MTESELRVVWNQKSAKYTLRENEEHVDMLRRIILNRQQPAWSRFHGEGLTA
jgi:hypothetical protein